MSQRFLLVIFAALCALPLGGCGGCTSSSKQAILRGRAGDFSDDEEDAPAPIPRPIVEDEPAPPAVTAAPQPASPTPVSPPPGPMPLAPTGPSPAAVASTTPAALRPVLETVPEVYPSDLVPRAPSDPLPEVTPVKQVVPPPRAGETLSPLDRRARTIDNLKRIGQAFTQYVSRHGTLPPRAIRNDRGVETLSWRVAILPQLGYDELYRQFRMHEPWDSPHNKQLLPQIPPELTSPERFDPSTNYVAVVGPDSALHGPRGVAPKSFEDGAENTILVVEVDEQFAVPWTKPADLVTGAASARQGLGALRGDGFLSLLADGRVKRVPPELPDTLVRALLTTDGGEPLSAAELLKEPTLEAVAAGAAPPDLLADLVAGVPKPKPPDPSSAIGSSAVADADLGRLPIPDNDSLLRSRALLRDLYGKEVQAARTLDERARLAVKLLAEAPKVEASASDYYELVRIARDMAAAAGDATTALKGADLLAKKYQLDAPAMEIKLLRDLAEPVKTRGPQVAANLAQRAKDLLIESFERDDYDLVFQAYDLLIDFSKLKGDREELSRMQKLKPGLEGARQAFAAIPDELKKLSADPNDAAANEAVGKYLCLVKNRWDAGLPLLVRSGDVKLRIVAAIDLEPVRSPENTLDLADQYWELAKDYKPPYNRGLHLRSITCYQQAVAQLGGSFDKLRAQKRLDEVIALYGKETIDRALGRAVTGSGVMGVSGGPVGVPVPVSGGGPRGVPVPGT